MTRLSAAKSEFRRPANSQNRSTFHRTHYSDSRRLRREVPLPIVSTSRFFAATALLASTAPFAFAQDAALPLPDVGASPNASPGASPDAAPSSGEAAAIEAVPSQITPAPTVAPSGDLPSLAANRSRLTAEKLSSSNGVIIAEGSAERLVRFESAAGTLTALRVELNPLAQTVTAHGQVRLEREVTTQRKVLQQPGIKSRTSVETTRETLVGENLDYNFKTSLGTLDGAQLQLASLAISTESLLLNGRRYTAKGVVLRPGALSEDDRRIYGTPPLNIRARSITASVGGAPGTDNVAVEGGGLFIRNTRILPVPGYVFRAGLNNGGGGGENTFKLTPSLSFNSADRVLVTTRFSYPLASDPKKLAVFADLGLSQRIGVRGGLGLRSETPVGQFQLRARRADVVETQLTNRIELDRSPELIYESPSLGAFALPGGRRAGFSIDGSYGDYAERRIGDSGGSVRATRAVARLLFSTRLKNIDGPYLRLFASTSRYGSANSDYNSRGFELGYQGTFSRLHGQISFRSSSLSGQTPFRFDQVEIARELRSTFDVELTPRYLLPIDLRYDLSRRAFRDKTFGILRSYKVFAYGIVYQTARRDLRLEVRQGF